MKDWLVNYKKMFGTDANTQVIIGYNAIEDVRVLCRTRPRKGI